MENEETGVLIQARAGAVYLHDTSWRAFCDVTRRLVEGENGHHYFIDLATHGNAPRNYPIHFVTGENYYNANIRPLLNEWRIQARVRSNEIPADSPFDPGHNSLYLKVNALGIGYVYFHANWYKHKQNDVLRQNSGQFLIALKILFPAAPDDYQSNQLTIHVPADGSYHIDCLSPPNSLDNELQESLSLITGQKGQRDVPAPATGKPPTEISVSQNVPLKLVRPAREVEVELLDVYNYNEFFRQVKVLYPDRNPQTPDLVAIRIMRKGGRLNKDLCPGRITEASFLDQGEWERHVRQYRVGRQDLVVIKCFVSPTTPTDAQTFQLK